MNKNDSEDPDQPSPEPKPLLGKRILITRARAQSQEITSQLQTLGAEVIHYPTIELVPPSSWAQVDDAITRLHEFDWIVFTSANGAHFFFRRMREIRGDAVAARASQIVCAIGPATANAVQQAGADVHVIADDSRGEGALAAIIDHVGGPGNLRGLSFLIPRARVAREILPDGLRQLGAQVETVETYQTVKPDVSAESIKRLFAEHSIDVITFTSSSTVSNFAELVGVSDLSDLLADTVVACIGPVTAETATNYGLKKVIQPDLYNTSQLVESILRAIGQPKESH